MDSLLMEAIKILGMTVDSFLCEAGIGGDEWRAFLQGKATTAVRNKFSNARRRALSMAAAVNVKFRKKVALAAETERKQMEVEAAEAREKQLEEEVEEARRKQMEKRAPRPRSPFPKW
jgi:hypothetical protein